MPASIRRHFGLMAGTQMEVIEEPNGLRLVITYPASQTNCIGMVTTPSRGVPRRLEDFDPATLVRKDAR